MPYHVQSDPVQQSDSASLDRLWPLDVVGRRALRQAARNLSRIEKLAASVRRSLREEGRRHG